MVAREPVRRSRLHRRGRGRAGVAALARVACHHRVRQCAGRARARDPVAGRPRPVWAGAVLRNRSLCGGVAQPLRRLAGRVSADRRRCGRGRHRRIPGRIPAGALSRHFLRDAQPRDVDDSLRRAGQDRDARLDRRLPRRVRDLPGIRASRPGAQSCAVLAGARAFGGQRLRSSRSISARSPARSRCRRATTRSVWNSSASRSPASSTSSW